MAGTSRSVTGLSFVQLRFDTLFRNKSLQCLYVTQSAVACCREEGKAASSEMIGSNPFILCVMQLWAVRAIDFWGRGWGKAWLMPN